MERAARDGQPVVVVPASPGPLVTAGRGRERDDLDELIDDLFPDTDEGAGPFDVALLVGGVGSGVWGVVGGPPWALVIGCVMACLGCVLPLRGVARRLQRRRHAAVLGRGVPLLLGHPSTARLAAAYQELVAVATSASLDGGPSLAAGHAALLETATLLRGQAPGTAAEADYAAKRADAIEQLTAALGAQDERPDDGQPAVATVVEAREELEALGGVSSLTRLEHLAAEARERNGRS